MLIFKNFISPYQKKNSGSRWVLVWLTKRP